MIFTILGVLAFVLLFSYLWAKAFQKERRSDTSEIRKSDPWFH